MEKGLNIAAILKDKPVGLKFYSPTFGCVTFNGVHKDKVYFFSKDTNAHSVKQNGKMFDDGECIIFPSKEMRDWEKFAWKKGDVLIGDCGFVCIFREWASDDYTKFNGCYFDGMPNAETAKYSKLDNNTAYSYIREIENRCGGKLNLETLKIEKQPEFKDGDIITIMPHIGDKLIYLFKAEDDEKYYGHAFLDVKNIAIVNEDSYCHKDFCTARPSTEEEKLQLFDALAEEGKAWDAEKKMIVDLKPKVELKPFDKVLIRDFKDQAWQVSLFGYKDANNYYCCNGSCWDQCIPYIGNESLLGTTKDVEG